MARPRGSRDLDLVVVGEINPDIILVDRDPRPVFGQAERLVEGIRLAIGSSSAITACGAARLGLRVAMVGVVGDDMLGRFMLETLRGRGVDTTWCRVAKGRGTGASMILGSGSDRAILTSMGTIADARAADVPSSLLARTRHIHVGSFFLQPALAAEVPALFEAARAAGASASLDPNWDPADRWDGGFGAAAAAADVVLPNEVEVTRIVAAMDPREAVAGDPVAAARRLVARLAVDRDGRGPILAVKLGAAGALVVGRDGSVTRAIAPATVPVDTTGAGDSFDAGFLAGWLDGRPPEACLALAVACGSLSTQAIGGTEAQPLREAAETMAATVRTHADERPADA